MTPLAYRLNRKGFARGFNDCDVATSPCRPKEEEKSSSFDQRERHIVALNSSGAVSGTSNTRVILSMIFFLFSLFLCPHISSADDAAVLNSVTSTVGFNFWDFDASSTPLSNICVSSSHVACDASYSYVVSLELSLIPALRGVSLSSLAGLSDLKGLTRLDLSLNGLTGILPERWGEEMQNIKYLALSANSLSGHLPPSWKSMEQLESLDLSDNQLEGPLPSSFSAMTKLIQLQLQWNRLSGHLPPSWKSMEQLEWLVLDFNRIDGPLPSEFSAMKKLSWVGLATNALTGVLPESWNSMEQLEWLYLSDNQIEGPIPYSWSSMSKLKELTLNFNSLRGQLPRSWQNMTQLEMLFLDHNFLVGDLPSEWAAMVSLNSVDLSSNYFEGAIPPEFGSLTSLTSFYASFCGLTGGVEHLVSISTLTLLVVSDNIMEGPLDFIRNAGDQLCLLNVSGNKFDHTLSSADSTLMSDGRETTPLLVDLRRMYFNCPFPTTNAASSVTLLHDACDSNYGSFLLNYCIPFLGVILGVFLLLKLGLCCNIGAVRQISKPMKQEGDSLTFTSHKRLKAMRLLMFSYMLYDNINDAFVYKNMIDVVDNDVFDNPCAAANVRGFFYPFMTYRWYNSNDPNYSYFPDVICTSTGNCIESDFVSYTQYLSYIDGWVDTGLIEQSDRDENVDIFASYCANSLLTDDMIQECSYSNATVMAWVKEVDRNSKCQKVEGFVGCRIEGPEGCVRVRNVIREKNQSYKPFIAASIAVFAIKELAKLLLVLFIWIRGPSRELLPMELSLVGESPFMVLLLWRRPGFLRELLLTQKTWKSYLVIFFVEDVLESVNQVTLIAVFALKVSQQGIEFGIMFSLTSSALKMLKTGYNLWTVWERDRKSSTSAKVQDEVVGG